MKRKEIIKSIRMNILLKKAELDNELSELANKYHQALENGDSDWIEEITCEIIDLVLANW